jgi:hypothetical protein
VFDLGHHLINGRHLRKAHREHGQHDLLDLRGRDRPEAQIGQITAVLPSLKKITLSRQSRRPGSSTRNAYW